MIKFLKYVILLIIHMFGATIMAVTGLIFIALTLAGVARNEYVMMLMGICGAVLSLLLQRVFIGLDPSYMYAEEDW